MFRISIFFLLILLVSGSLFAAEYRSGESITIREDDSLETDLFAGSRYVTIRGVVSGDIYVGCEELTVEGEVFDDVLAGCRQLEIKGRVHDMVIGFGQTILIDGVVDGDVLAFGGMLRITERAKIRGNVFTGAGELLMEGGSIGGNLSGGAGKIYLNGYVKGKVELEANDIDFGESYQAKGGTRLTLHKDISEYKLTHTPDDLDIVLEPMELFFEEFFFFWYTLSLLIVSFLLVIFFKNFSADYLSYSSDKIGQSLGYGFLALILTPIAMAVLAILILTIPLSLILLACYLIAIYLGIAFSALFAGDFVLGLFKKEEGSKNLYLAVLVGVVLIVLLQEMPFIGWLFSLLIICFGFGSLVCYLWYLKKMIKTAKTG